MPVRFIEGVRGDMADEVNRRNIERRFYALAAAVREHEARTRRAGDGCGRDQALYLRLRELCGQSEAREFEVV